MLFHLHIVYGCFYYNQLFRQRPSDIETLNCLLFGFLMQKKKNASPGLGYFCNYLWAFPDLYKLKLFCKLKKNFYSFNNEKHCMIHLQ